MINLLPSNTRQDIQYARRNTILMHWTIATLIGIAGIIIVIVFGFLIIDQTTDDLERQVAENRQDLKAQKLEDTQKEVQDISNSFKLVTQVLSRQILFSELIPKIGAAMPSGAALANLSLNNELEGGIDLEASAVDYQSATQVQVNLEDPKNEVFAEVDIVSITCGNTNTEYKCTGVYRALFGEDNSFTLLDSSNGVAQ